jgi:Tol biopolymer transport system component
VELEDLKEESDSGKLTAALPGAQTSVRRSSRTPLWIGIGLVVVLGGVAGARFWTDKPVTGPPLQAVPLTSYTGIEDEPSFSPDGNQVAFRWNGEKEDNFDIYVKLIGSGAPLRLTTDPASDDVPSWSPDGRTIAFERLSGQGRAMILTVPPLGGPERKLAEVLLRPGFSALGGMAWSRDSKSLIVSAVDRPNEPNRLVLISLETGERKILTNPPVPTLVGDGAPALSPDGRTLAFLRETGMNLASLFVMDLASDLTPLGEPRQVPTPGLSPSSPTWKQDGLEIVFASGQRNAAVLYSVPASGKSPPALLQGGGAGVGDAAISGTAHRMVYSSFVQNSIIYRTTIDGKGPSEKFIASTFRESFPQYSADGKRITFYSNRSGTVQIWISAADGSSAQQITDMSGPTTGSPRWSPDGKKISFDSNTGGNWQIYTISPDGGKPQPITNDIYTNVTSNWSRDGHWIYFASRRSGAMEVWKIPAGGGAAVQVTRTGGTAPVESPDGKWLY